MLPLCSQNTYERQKCFAYETLYEIVIILRILCVNGKLSLIKDEKIQIKRWKDTNKIWKIQIKDEKIQKWNSYRVS